MLSGVQNAVPRCKGKRHVLIPTLAKPPRHTMVTTLPPMRSVIFDVSPLFILLHHLLAPKVDPASVAIQQTNIQHGTIMRFDHLSKEEATAIQKSLEKYKVAQWGFVLFRCTYGSQEKWDKFVALLKADAHDFFEWRDMEHVYDSLAWTIIEDAETLDGAGIVETSRRFRGVG